MVVPTSAQASAPSRARGRACARGGAVVRHPAAAGAFVRVHDECVPAGDRCRGDHRHDLRTTCADDARQRWPRALNRARAERQSGSAARRSRHRCQLKHSRSVDFRQCDPRAGWRGRSSSRTAQRTVTAASAAGISGQCVGRPGCGWCPDQKSARGGWVWVRKSRSVGIYSSQPAGSRVERRLRAYQLIMPSNDGQEK
jgi:hypothetical protein